MSSNESKKKQRSSTASELDTSDNIDNQPVYPVFKQKNKKTSDDGTVYKEAVKRPEFAIL
jgi:hypothetical protein